MEREIARPNELTDIAARAYSRSGGFNSMADGSGVGERPPITGVAEQVTPLDVRTQEMARRAKEFGVDIDSRGMETLRKMAEMNLDPFSFAGGSPDDPNPPDISGANPAQSEEREQRRILAEENPGLKAASDEEEMTPEQQREFERNYEKAKKVKADSVIEWIIDQDKREDFFNEIYSLVDSRPYDFWQTAFDPLTDGAIEHHFNQTLLRASKGMWSRIEAGAREGVAGIQEDKVRTALSEKLGREATDEDMQNLTQQIENDYHRFQRERQVRRMLHDVNAILYLPTVKAEDLFNTMNNFDSASGDIALSMPGVRDMMNIYESVLREIMAENGGFLPDEMVRGKPSSEISGDKNRRSYSTPEAERRTKERFKQMADAGLIVTRAKTAVGDKNKVWETKVSQNLPSYELDRIFTLSRGMMIMEERLISIAAESRYPLDSKGEPDPIRNASAFLQDVIQSTSTYRHLLGKWGITDEAIAAYLFEDKHDETIARYFKGWNPDTLKKIYKEFSDNKEALFESLDQNFYLGRANPNRAGDIFTWISWRANPSADVRSMLQDYLQTGQDRMAERLSDPNIRKAFEANRKKIEAVWKELHPKEKDVPGLEDLLKDEYVNWTGTGFRFEKLRGDLAKFGEHGEEREKFEKAYKQAVPLIGRMVDLQPHRIYLVSRWVRERVGEKLTEAQKKTLSDDLANLSMVETAFLNAREELLNRGKTFDTIDVEDGDMDEFYEQVISDKLNEKGDVMEGESKEERIKRAKDLAAAVRADFAENKDEYWKEFIYHRENTHGYVLWSGDTPADEYNFSALGATGGFARRARDNLNQTKATELEVAMLDNLKNMNHPDQIVAALYGIFQPIDHYERGKAQKAIAEKAEGIIKFYKANVMTDIPIIGATFFKGRRSASFARMMYGPHAAAWEASDIRYFIEKLEHSKMITEHDAHKLMIYTGAEKKHIAYEESVNASQLFAVAFFLLMVEQVVKEGLKSNDIS